jgi:hypothetical protein
MIARLNDGSIVHVVMINNQRMLADRKDGGDLCWVEISDIQGISMR